MTGEARPEGKWVYMTDFFLVPDGQGGMRRVYRTGCPRCGKEPLPGKEFCQGHAYMEGRSRDLFVRKELAKAPGIGDRIRNWLQKIAIGGER